MNVTCQLLCGAAWGYQAVSGISVESMLLDGLDFKHCKDMAACRKQPVEDTLQYKLNSFAELKVSQQFTACQAGLPLEQKLQTSEGPWLADT